MCKWVRTEDGILVNLDRMDYVGPEEDGDCIIAVTGNPDHPENCNVLYRGSAEARGKMMDVLHNFLNGTIDTPVHDVLHTCDETIGL